MPAATILLALFSSLGPRCVPSPSRWAPKRGAHGVHLCVCVHETVLVPVLRDARGDVTCLCLSQARRTCEAQLAAWYSACILTALSFLSPAGPCRLLYACHGQVAQVQLRAMAKGL